LDPKPVLKRPENVAVEKFFNIGQPKEEYNFEPPIIRKVTSRKPKLTADFTDNNKPVN